MSSCPTAPTSTIDSSRNSPSRAEAPVLVIACGALGAHLREIISRRGWPAELHCLPALLHNRPEKITIHAERLAGAALLRRAGRAGADPGRVRGRARHLRPHRLPGPELRQDRARGTRPRPVPGTVAGLLRALPPGGLAGPGPGSGPGGGGGAGRGPVRAAAHHRGHRDQPPGTGTGGADRRGLAVIWGGPFRGGLASVAPLL